LIDLLSIHWILGDLLNFAEVKFGEMASQLEHEWGFTYQTMADDKWVSSKFEISRRREKIKDYTKYKEIAALDIDEQETNNKSNAENVKYIFDKVFDDNFMSHTPIVVLAHRIKYMYLEMKKLNVNIELGDIRAEFILKVITFYTPENIEKELQSLIKTEPQIDIKRITDESEHIVKGLEKYIVHNSLKKFM